MTDRFSDRVCATCACPATGYGYAPHPSKKVAWVCSEECLQPARNTYNMSKRDFIRLDSMAAIEGGKEAGAYLEELGRFALDELTEDEWAEFCRRLVGGYRAALDTTLRDDPPF